MSYGDDNQDQDSDQFGKSTLGNYRMDPQTGAYQPYGSRPVVNKADPNSVLANIINQYERAAIRKQSTPGSSLPLTSVAPASMLQMGQPLDKYRTFGVPYTGIPYQSTNFATASDPYSAMFSQAPSSGGY